VGVLEGQKYRHFMMSVVQQEDKDRLWIMLVAVIFQEIS
jgi:hypothetical protein